VQVAAAVVECHNLAGSKAVGSDAARFRAVPNVFVEISRVSRGALRLRGDRYR
jgi:hypothetical protein